MDKKYKTEFEALTAARAFAAHLCKSLSLLERIEIQKSYCNGPVSGFLVKKQLHGVNVIDSVWFEVETQEDKDRTKAHELVRSLVNKEGYIVALAAVKEAMKWARNEKK